MAKFNNKSRPISKEENEEKDTYESAYALYEGRKLTLSAFKSGIFPIKEKKGKGFKTLTPKQMLQRLPIALAQVKADSATEYYMKSDKSYILCTE